jgi:hypothetical protein
MLYIAMLIRLASTDSNVYYAHVRDAATSTTPRAVCEFQKKIMLYIASGMLSVVSRCTDLFKKKLIMWTLTLTTPRSVLLCEFFQKKSYFARSTKLVQRKITCVAQTSITDTLCSKKKFFARPTTHEQWVSSKKNLMNVILLCSG